MKKILIAGATGYLGKHLIAELQERQLPFQAIARNPKKLEHFQLPAEALIRAEVTQPATLRGQLAGIDTLISTVGITRQKDGLTYMNVDYQANLNLMEEAKRAGVRQFIYISAINGRQMRHLKIMAAKERFVDALMASGLEYQIVRPNGFFSDMTDFLGMAKGGRVYLFGNGNYKLNPIHGRDLAKTIIDEMGSSATELEVGGPDILTQNEIAALALKAVGRPPKILHLPDWSRRLLIWLMRTFTSSKTYGPYEFFLTMMAQDNVAPRYGVERLEHFFRKEADEL
ncbi:MAG: SDR family oxidoreductase [Phaeodactylibacter xiamenensis]|uniref:Divinyl chlorophyllide a 8-vinyl-reductase, chloroplastic n=1 Tax=Phaeodactylibacter xiamenensis TaxID=1524460 RepID=A0A098S1M8_9BACT|nr:SDR family oxidoreductase [Phaeodactylibacter xiamenensis]KGE85047.1 NAD-dependent dehydratase [Phaeodactylibacter xiamenensis]